MSSRMKKPRKACNNCLFWTTLSGSCLIAKLVYDREQFSEKNPLDDFYCSRWEQTEYFESKEGQG